MVKKIFAKSYVYLILFLLYLPILFLIVFSFTSAETTGDWASLGTDFTFELYIKVFQNAKIMTALGNTLLIATVIGCHHYWRARRSGVFSMKKKPRQVLESINEIPVVNAEIVIAISLAILFKVFTNMLGSAGGKNW